MIMTAAALALDAPLHPRPCVHEHVHTTCTRRRQPGAEVTLLDPGLLVLGGLTMDRACWMARCSGASARLEPPSGAFTNATSILLNERATIEDVATCQPRLRACIPVRRWCGAQRPSAWQASAGSAALMNALPACMRMQRRHACTSPSVDLDTVREWRTVAHALLPACRRATKEVAAVALQIATQTTANARRGPSRGASQ